MSIDGPEGPGRLGAVPPREIKQEEAVDGATFDGLLDGDVAAAEGAPQASMDGIAARVQAGELSGPQAAELLIDATAKKMGRMLEPALRERIRAELKRMLEEDPVLADKVKQLAGG